MFWELMAVSYCYTYEAMEKHYLVVHVVVKCEVPWDGGHSFGQAEDWV